MSGFDCVKKTRERHAVGEMRGGPSESPCRRRLQTAMSCFGQKPRWWTSWLKGAALTASCMGERDERKQTSGWSIVRLSDDVETGAFKLFREEHGGYPTYWPCGVRCRGGVTLIRAFLRNLRTWPVMPREKAQAEKPRGRKYRCTGEGRTASQ